MLCVACGQLTTGDFSVPCELCGRMQIVGEKYVLVHMVGLVGHVRTYSAIRMEDEKPFTCTLWPMPEGASSSEDMNSVQNTLASASSIRGCVPMEEWFLADGQDELFVDIRQREGMMWLSPTRDGELWDLERVQGWLDSMAALAFELSESDLHAITPCFRIGRLLVDKETDQIYTIDPGIVRSHLYAEFALEKNQMPILKRLNLEMFWHSWAASAIQLLGGTSIYGLNLLHEACSELEQNTLLDLLEGVVKDKQEGMETTNPFRLEAMRNLLVDCAQRYANRAPTVATKPIEKWVAPTFVRREKAVARPTKTEPTSVPAPAKMDPVKPKVQKKIPKEIGEADTGSVASASVDETQTNGPPDLRKIQARKIHRAKMRRRRKIADATMLCGLTLVFLGWPMLAWQWSFSEENNLEQNAGREAALTSVLRQVALNPEFVSCLDSSELGTYITLRWSGDVRPNLRAFTNNGARSHRMTTCLESSVLQSALKWNVPLSGQHETIIAWEVEAPEE